MTKKIFIVAEIGNNHEGDFRLAKKLIHRAYECGVDAVKFQIFKTNSSKKKENWYNHICYQKNTKTIGSRIISTTNFIWKNW